MKPTPWPVRAGLLIGYLILASNRTGAAEPAAFQPPIPPSLVEAAQNAGRPFLIADRRGYREMRDRIHDPVFRESGREFAARAEGYFIQGSPWRLGGGPFGDEPGFYPERLRGEDFAAYQKIVFEVCAFIGVEQERESINRAKKEYPKLLEALERLGNESGAPGALARRAHLLALATLLHDEVYNRFETTERHDLANRLKRQRDLLAGFAALAEPQALPPDERLVVAAGLGFSTLSCIAMYPDEWERAQPFSVQTLLPDLFWAVQTTRSAMADMVTPGGRFLVELGRAETALHLSIPWIECMKRLGYPFAVPGGTYAELAAALDAHRVPGANLVIQPAERADSPWIPPDRPILANVDTRYYEEIKNAGGRIVDATAEAEREREGRFDLDAPSALGNLPDTSGEAFEYQSGGLRPMTLREQMERFGFPKRPTPPPAPAQDNRGPAMEESGWRMPSSLVLPSLWGSLYLLAALEDPRGNFAEYWANEVYPRDTHPFNMLFWKPLKAARDPAARSKTLIRYPESRFVLANARSPYVDYLMASQSAAETVLHSTFAIDHESFFLSENGTRWRWHHERPVTAAGIPAAASNPQPATADAPQSATDAEQTVFVINRDEPPGRGQAPVFKTAFEEITLESSLYSCWTTHAPVGKTVVIRRHIGGPGNAYSVIAHFPDPAVSPEAQIRYVNFQMHTGSDTASVDSVPGLLQLIPPDARENQDPASFEEWQRLRRAERSGALRFQETGILNVLFSPEALRRASVSEGVLGRFLETELETPAEPFFYTVTVEQAGRPKFETLYATLPIPGQRVIEWGNGVEYMAQNPGGGIDTDFIRSDADFVLVTRDTAHSAIFYLMVNGTRLQAKFSTTQRTWTTLAGVKGGPVTAAWAERRVHANTVPGEGSAFYAPGALGFESAEGDVPFGRRANQAVVLGGGISMREGARR